MKTDLLALIDRCATNPGHDRELDVLIAEYLDPVRTPSGRVMYYGEPTGEHVLSDGIWSKCLQFTKSLDAAMTLIPRGWTQGAIAWPGYLDSKFVAHVRVELRHELSSGGAPRVIAFGATHALAICGAALQAIATDAGEAI
jgi:hypothetical protein